MGATEAELMDRRCSCRLPSCGLTPPRVARHPSSAVCVVQATWEVQVERTRREGLLPRTATQVRDLQYCGGAAL